MEAMFMSIPLNWKVIAINLVVLVGLAVAIIAARNRGK
jgi:hypothetical protein